MFSKFQTSSGNLLIQLQSYVGIEQSRKNL